jgi:thiol:disulfide interchange protein
METLDDLKTLLEANPGMIFLKFEADWCGPCKKIKSHVLSWFKRLPPNAQAYIVDIDESLEIYATLKTKRIISGIPSIVMYRKGNVSLAPNESVSGSNPADVDAFFTKSLQHA